MQKILYLAMALTFFTAMPLYASDVEMLSNPVQQDVNAPKPSEMPGPDEEVLKLQGQMNMESAQSSEIFASSGEVFEIPSGTTGNYTMGEMLFLPDGKEIYIERELADGTFAASDNRIITSEGKVKETGQEVRRLELPQLEIGSKFEILPGKEDVIVEKFPDGSFRTEGGYIITPRGRVMRQVKEVGTMEEAQAYLEEPGQEGEKKTAATGGGGTKRDRMQEIAGLLSDESLSGVSNKTGSQGSEKSVKKSGQMSSGKNASEVTRKKGEKTGEKNAKQASEKATKQTDAKTAAAKKGDKLIIPPGTYESGDLSFLNGCWHSRAVTYYNGFTPYKQPADLCFDGKNRGSFISYIDGAVCRAGTTVRIVGKSILIQAGQGPCGRGAPCTATLPRVFQCEGVGANSECYILAKDSQDVRRKFKSVTVFNKK